MLIVHGNLHFLHNVFMWVQSSQITRYKWSKFSQRKQYHALAFSFVKTLCSIAEALHSQLNGEISWPPKLSDSFGLINIAPDIVCLYLLKRQFTFLNPMFWR